VYRQKFIHMFCRPVYEQWLAEAVAIGRIQAPGFFDDPAVRQAWSGSTWMGSSMGHIDPLKEVKAAAERIRNNISTEEAEAIAYDGADWNANIRQRKKEITALGNHEPQGRQTGGTNVPARQSEATDSARQSGAKGGDTDAES